MSTKPGDVVVVWIIITGKIFYSRTCIVMNVLNFVSYYYLLLCIMLLVDSYLLQQLWLRSFEKGLVHL